jgi:hypothetical protein
MGTVVAGRRRTIQQYLAAGNASHIRYRLR